MKHLSSLSSHTPRIYRVWTICLIALLVAQKTEPSVRVAPAPTPEYGPNTFPEVYTVDEVKFHLDKLRADLTNADTQLRTELMNKLNRDLDEFNIRVLNALNQGKPVSYLRSDAQTKQIQEEVRKEVQAQYAKRIGALEAKVAALENRGK